MLTIENLHVQTDEGSHILKGLSLSVNPGEIHAIMGPNGAGKSTFAKVVAGFPGYAITDGKILLKGEEIQELDPEERSHLGLFMGFQYPIEVAGITNAEFLFAAKNANLKARGLELLSQEAFDEYLEKQLESMQMKSSFLKRDLNAGFSGGEKKRNEILQMRILDPSLAILDETDSGLDIDAMRVVAAGVNQFMDASKGLILITHYKRLLDYIKPDFIHVMIEGRIVRTGDASLADELEAKGYDWLLDPALVV